ncbi:hypothetical protein I308_105185 [Cryptococcus tetragattii IND107]|uniref:GATA-type domain-containing protein n=1 Tax=Cryptococcus tetragattii IND107 TaxID=1296105 RepID=A0ABR3BMA2_9TREE
MKRRKRLLISVTPPTLKKRVKKRRTFRPGRCANCGCTESGQQGTSLWRTNVDAEDDTGKIVCNACGLWRAEHGFPRPKMCPSGSTYSNSGPPSPRKRKFLALNIRKHGMVEDSISEDDVSDDRTDTDEVTDAAFTLMKMVFKVLTDSPDVFRPKEESWDDIITK